MHPGDFQRKLKKLNSKLYIFCGDDDSKPAGIWHYKNGEYTQICGIDKNEIPVHPIRDEKGHIIKGGWRRVIALLCAIHLIDRHASYEHFGHWDEQRIPEWQPEQDYIQNEILQVQRKGYWKKDELVDIGREINKRKPTTVEAPVPGRNL